MSMPTVALLKTVSEEEFNLYVGKLEQIIGLREDAISETKSLWILPGSMPRTLARKEIKKNANIPLPEYTEFQIADIPIGDISHI